MAHSSIGNMTNTLIETGSRHMQQCRTNYDVLAAMAGTEENLLNNDDKWCMAKDELAVACTKHIDSNAAKTATKYAYPSVVTTIGETTVDEKVMLASHYHFMGQLQGSSLKQMCFKDGKSTKKADQYREFVPVGYSVGRACAHGYKGDTVASVQIGGLRTVLNGAFHVATGDLIQMYIPSAEANMFNAEAGRRNFNTPEDIKAEYNDDGSLQTAMGQSEQEKKRMNFYTRGQGIGNTSSERIKTGMFSIKPYMETANELSLQYYGDKIRVFARAVSSARPYEPVDIMISRQSL
jgi:lipoprotein-anchoring transpeptidase ErfK/SrfK